MKERILPILNSVVSGILVTESAIRGDLPSSIANGMTLLNSIKNIFNRRIYNFTLSLAKEIEEIESQFPNFTEKLTTNDKFLSAFAYALQIAARDHRQEKLNVLRRAILNTAILNEPDEDLQFSFINYVDGLGPSHLVALQEFEDDYNHKSKLPTFEIERKYENYLSELVSFGLLSPPSPPAPFEVSLGIISPHTITDKGKQFLEFIKSPVVTLSKNPSLLKR